MNMLDGIKNIGIPGVLDIVFMSLLVYVVLVWFKRTRASFVVRGIIIVTIVYLLARQFNLVMTASVFEKFFAVILIILVVIFQEELRHFFEEIALWSLNRGQLKSKGVVFTSEEVEALVRTVVDFAREKIGALIVLRGKDMIVRHLDGEIELNGKLSEQLLKSIFDPNSLGHDGAVVIEGGRVTQFGCHLPLSKNLSKIKNHGTRHAAALGLSEVTDALCLVVSEERGKISVVRGGDIEQVDDVQKLTGILDRFYQERMPRKEKNIWTSFFTRNYLEKVYAICITTALWLVLVYGGKMTYETISIPVVHDEIAKPWVIVQIEPKEVILNVQGPRRAFYFYERNQMNAPIDIKLEEGTQKIRIEADKIVIPKSIAIDHIETREIKVHIEKKIPQNLKEKTLVEKESESHD